MALSAGLIHRLNRDDADEPLAKRLKLATNVFYSAELSIVHKEDHILSWLTSELSKNENTLLLWNTILRCITAKSNIFSKLSPETKQVLVDKLTAVLNDYPKSKVFDSMLKCCDCIFLSSSVKNSFNDKIIIDLLEATLRFTNGILDSNLSNTENEFQYKDLALECAEHAIAMYFQICKEGFMNREDLLKNFIDILIVPITCLVKILREKKIQSKVILEVQKGIKRLLFSGIKTRLPSDDEDMEKIFDSLKNKISTLTIEDTTSVVSCIFQCVVNTYQQSSEIVDYILRKLAGCSDDKEKSKYILISLLDNSIDVSYDLENEIDGITFKSFLTEKCSKIATKRKPWKYADYKLLSSIAILNPVLIEDLTLKILESILLKDKTPEVGIAFENLLKDLWDASVRLRRQQKFLSKILVAINNHEGRVMNEVELVKKYDLPQFFLSAFGEDLLVNTTNSQILAMFHTLTFHLKSDCFSKLNTSDATAPYLMVKIVTQLLITFFENSNIVDSCLTKEWYIKFYQNLNTIKDVLVSSVEDLGQNKNNCFPVIFKAFSDLIKIWCEVNDLLKYYVPEISSSELDFPLNETQFKEMKQVMKKNKNCELEETMNETLLFKSLVEGNNIHEKFSIKEKIVSQLWSEILINHFNLIQFLDESKLLKLSSELIREACSSQEKLLYWTSTLKNNIPRMSKKFATAIIFAIIENIVGDVGICSVKKIAEKIEFEQLLTGDPEIFKKTLKKIKKELKASFSNIEVPDSDKIERNLTFLSNLPLIFLETNVRILLFIVLYTLEEESKSSLDLKNSVSHSYLGILHQNDFDILHYVSNPLLLITHFKDEESILKKIFKLSFNDQQSLKFWEEFVKDKKCNRKISSILISCIDISRKTLSSESRPILTNLSLKLKEKILKEPFIETKDPDELCGLRISIKIALGENKNLEPNLKKYAETILKEVTQKSEATNDAKVSYEYLQFSLTLLSHRESFKVSEDVVKNMGEMLIHNPDGKIISHFFEILKDNEFGFFAKSLCSTTEKSFINSDVNSLEKVIIVWEHLSKVETKASRSKILCSSVNNLLDKLITLEVQNSSSVYLLKICRTFVVSKRMVVLTDRIIDSIFITSTECLKTLDKDSRLQASQEALGLGLDFLRSKSEFLVDRLPVLVNFFRKVIPIILHEAKVDAGGDEEMLKILAIDIEKFCSFFAKLKKDVVRISPYLIADLVEATMEAGVLPFFLKTSIETSVSYLLSNCDRHAISFLSRTLPLSTQQVFKTMYDNYMKYHKFTGKI